MIQFPYFQASFNVVLGGGSVLLVLSEFQAQTLEPLALSSAVQQGTQREQSDQACIILTNERSSAPGKYFHGESNLETTDGAIVSADLVIPEQG